MSVKKFGFNISKFEIVDVFQEYWKVVSKLDSFETRAILLEQKEVTFVPTACNSSLVWTLLQCNHNHKLSFLIYWHDGVSHMFSILIAG